MEIKEKFTFPENNCFVDNFTFNQMSSLVNVPDVLSSMPILTVLFSFLTVAVIAYSIFLWIQNYRLKYFLRLNIIAWLICACLNKWYEPGREVQDILDTTTAWRFQELPSSVTASNVFAAISIIMIIVRYHWSMPINMVMSDCEYGIPELKNSCVKRGLTVKGNTLRHRRLPESYPVYSNGWIPLVESREITKGKVISVAAIGQNFCVFRGESGKVYVMDKYCPHLGADLTAGGQVRGDCIECPFHGWQFKGEDGGCHRIPYAAKALQVAKVKTWTSCEKNDMIFVWHHAEGEPPNWEIPALPEIETKQYKYRGRSEITVNCHMQEIPENGADVAHLEQIHSLSVLCGVSFQEAGIMKHVFIPNWEPDKEFPHKARLSLVQQMQFFGYSCPLLELRLQIQQIGPAFVLLELDSPYGHGYMMQYVIPEEPLRQRIIHHLYTEPKWKQFVANCTVWAEGVMLQRDAEMWNNKIFLKNPLLVKEDKLINSFRRWYSQFYSKNSPTLKDLRERTLDW